MRHDVSVHMAPPTFVYDSLHSHKWRFGDPRASYSALNACSTNAKCLCAVVVRLFDLVARQEPPTDLSLPLFRAVTSEQISNDDSG